MDEENALEHLESKYLLVKKGKWWSFLGGAFAFLVVAGLVSYQAALAALEGKAAKTATDSILQLGKDARTGVAETERTLQKAKEIISTLRDPEYLAGWTLVFENNEKGEVVSGNVLDLADAIRKGADLKIYMNTKKAGREVTAACDWVFIDTSSSEEVVSCMNTSNVSVQATIGKHFGGCGL